MMNPNLLPAILRSTRPQGLSAVFRLAPSTKATLALPNTKSTLALPSTTVTLQVGSS